MIKAEPVVVGRELTITLIGIMFALLYKWYKSVIARILATIGTTAVC
jgi:hypothetical protein